MSEPVIPTSGLHAPGSYGVLLPGVELRATERDAAVYVHGVLFGRCFPVRSGQWGAWAYKQGYHPFLKRAEAEAWLVEQAEREASR